MAFSLAKIILLDKVSMNLKILLWQETTQSLRLVTQLHLEIISAHVLEDGEEVTVKDMHIITLALLLCTKVAHSISSATMKKDCGLGKPLNVDDTTSA